MRTHGGGNPFPQRERAYGVLSHVQCCWSKYCSHLNPVERIWLRLKNTLAANRLYGSMRLLVETTEAFFMQMTPEQALRWAAA